MNVTAAPERKPFKVGDPAYILDRGFLWLVTITDNESNGFAFYQGQYDAKPRPIMAVNLYVTKEEAKLDICLQINRLRRELEKVKSGHYEHLA